MKIRILISYLLLAVYTIVLVHTCIPHDHHNHDVMALMEGTDVCYMCHHHEDDDQDHHFHHHPISHHEECQHIDKFLKTTDIRDVFYQLYQICEPVPTLLAVPLVAENHHSFIFSDSRVSSGPLIVHRPLRAPPVL